MKTTGLKPSEREFLARVNAAVYVNPFLREAPALSELLGPRATEGGPDAHAALAFPGLVVPVQQCLAELASRGLRRLDALAEADRPLLRDALVFAHYHRYLDDFDALIAEQQRLGAAPAAVPFAPAFLDGLRAHGFADDEARRYLEFCYQLRRAYQFIASALVGISPAMQRLRAQLWNSLFTADARRYARMLWARMEDFSLLLLGPTGAGKGAAASALGQGGFIAFDLASGRFERGYSAMLVPANLAALPENLVEAALFGHRKGAFTGAIETREGLFDRCPAHGLLFLDEIGELPPTLQVKLLNVLQERHYTPVGSSQPRRFAGRVIAATHRPIAEARRNGQLRDDFYYRLCSNLIELPSLSQRLDETPEELELLVGLLLGRMLGSDVGDESRRVVDALRSSLPADYPWPGNVRELEQAVRRVLLGEAYRGDPLLRSETTLAANGYLAAVASGQLDAVALLDGYCARLYEECGSWAEVARRSGLDPRTARRRGLRRR